MSIKKYPKVLSIAGSDSGGGAGIQADLKTFAAFGVYGCTAITALTAQNTLGVSAVYPVSGDFLASQLDAVLSDIEIDAVKIGMLFSSELISIVAEKLKEYKLKNIVLDPVMLAQSGDKLLKDEAVEAIKKDLMPIASLVTPNLPEAEVLLAKNLNSFDSASQAAKELALNFSSSVLVKGGHLKEDNSDDCLFSLEDNDFHIFKGRRIISENSHGTGCTLSSAIAAGLAKGLGLVEAISRAKEYIEGAIEASVSYEIGRGHGPLNHFFKFTGF